MGPSPTSNIVTFEIDNTTPASVTDFRLNPADETGVSGSDVTTDRQPYFIGTTTPGYTVELFINGQTAVQSTAVAGSTQMDANGKSYNFLIQLPFNLNNGETSAVRRGGRPGRQRLRPQQFGGRGDHLDRGRL